MLFFKKKKPEKMPALGKGYLPTDRVKELSSKGFSEPEMIDILRKEGFSADEIDKGLTDALRAGVTGPAPTATAAPVTTPSPPALPTLEQLVPKAETLAMPERSLPQGYYQGYSPEEYIDYILRERMEEFDDKINQFMARYADVERKMAEIHEQLGSLSRVGGH